MESFIAPGKISLGKTKKNLNYNFKSIPILYDGKPFEMFVYGDGHFYSFNKNQLSIGIEIDKENRDYFEKIEKRISELYGKKVQIIKRRGSGQYYTARVYVKLFVKNEKVQTPLRIFFYEEEDFGNPFDYVKWKIPWYASIAMKISRIYDGKCISIICEADEFVVHLKN